MPEDRPRVVFRVPRLAYLLVLFLFLGTVPIAFTASGFTFDSKGNTQGAPVYLGWQLTFLIIPAVAAMVIARTATIVSPDGITVRAAFGSRTLPWDDVRGLSVTGRSVYAVLGDGSMRLPCVGVPNLAAMARASGGRLPGIVDPKPKYAPTRRPHR